MLCLARCYTSRKLSLHRFDHVSVYLSHLRQSFEHLDSRLLLWHLVVDWVSNEEHVAEVCEAGKLVELAPLFD